MPIIGSCTVDNEILKYRLNAMPTIDPEDLRPHGKWIKTGKISVRCSACNYLPAENDYKYCPNCGAEMERSK